MSYPNRFLRSDAAGAAPLPSLVPRPMDFFKLQDRFWQLDAEQSFSPAETRLYFYWLNRFNREYWPGCLPRTVKQVSADLSMDEKTVDRARKGLEDRALITYQAGNKKVAAQWFLPAQVERKNSGQSAKNSPQIDRNFSGANEGNSENSPQMDRKNSAPIYKEKTKTSSVVENKDTPTPLVGVGATSPSKKNEAELAPSSAPSESPSLTSANSGGAAAGELAEPLRTEARTLATAIALNWQISEQKNFQKWARIFRFAQLLAAAGQLDELRRQFKAYHSYRVARGIAPYNLDKYLGHETNLSPEGMPYADGEWCGRDWQATLQEEQQAQATKAAARTSHGPAPTATHVAGSQAQRVARQEEKSFI